MDPKLHFSLMIHSSGVAGFDWDSSMSFSDSKSGIYTKVRSGSTDKMKRLVTKNPSGATVLGKFRPSLVGRQETCMLFHINVIFPMDAIPVSLQELCCIYYLEQASSASCCQGRT